MKKILTFVILTISLCGCEGWKREVSGCFASKFGSDWVVAQYDLHGIPFNAWILRGVSVENEPSSDGIQWLDTDGHLVHISGWYNRVQVENGDFVGACRLIGVDIDLVKNGAYAP